MFYEVMNGSYSRFIVFRFWAFAGSLFSFYSSPFLFLFFCLLFCLFAAVSSCGFAVV